MQRGTQKVIELSRSRQPPWLVAQEKRQGWDRGSYEQVWISGASLGGGLLRDGCTGKLDIQRGGLRVSECAAHSLLPTGLSSHSF